MEGLQASKMPDWITIETESGRSVFPGGEEAREGDVRVSLADGGEGLSVRLTAGNTPVKGIRLRWKRPFARGTRFLGGAWERGYGDLEWRGIVPERVLPWYFLAAEKGGVFACGVKTQPSAICYWQADGEGATLFLDMRCGTDGVVLGGRGLIAAEVVFREYPGADAFGAACRFCGELCNSPLRPPHPVYGGNNWYYAYGESSHEDILADAAFMAQLSEGLSNRPYMVIDDGWQIRHDADYNGGPWRKGNVRFPDMKALADGIRAKGVRPGIWVRLLLNRGAELSEEAHSMRDARYLDPSHPEVLRQVEEDVRTLAGWGYELIKHDFSTFDIFGRWGKQMEASLTDGRWHFWDRGKTSAEIITDFYRAVRRGAGDALILGCNCIGHLGAGLMHMNRTGDDTSGRLWERTRRMGVNTLAFTLPQNRRFFDIDADCAGITGQIPWEKNRQWLELLARSGSPLFVSVKPGTAGAEQEEALRQAFSLASRQTEQAVPLDWTESTCPSVWRIGGEKREYHWYEEEGLSSFEAW